MKTIKEKAQRYDEAIRKAKKWYDANTNKGYREIFEEIFPELIESEDEKIRKELINYFKYGVLTPEHQERELIESWIAWLEKQGENVHNEELSKLLNEVICHFINNPDIPYSKRDEVSKKIIPYVEKLEKQGEEKPKRIVSAEAKEAMYDKPAWSEEDERMYRGLHNLIYSTPYCDSRKELSDWFKSLKDRVQPQPKQEWSEEDERIYKSIMYSFAHNYPLIVQQQEFIKSLKDRYTWKPSDNHYELEEFAKIVRSNLTGISKAVQELFEAKYLQLTGNKMYGGFKD